MAGLDQQYDFKGEPNDPTLHGCVPEPAKGYAGIQGDIRPNYVNGEFPKDSQPTNRYVLGNVPD